jgi:hypothetical protein
MKNRPKSRRTPKAVTPRTQHTAAKPSRYEQEEDHGLGLNRPVLRTKVDEFLGAIKRAADLSVALGVGCEIFLDNCEAAVDVAALQAAERHRKARAA